MFKWKIVKKSTLVMFIIGVFLSNPCNCFEKILINDLLKFSVYAENFEEKKEETFIESYVIDPSGAISFEVRSYIEAKNAKRREGRSHLYVYMKEKFSEDINGRAEKIFLDLNLSDSDILLILNEQKWNDYYILQGKAIRHIITEKVLQNALNTELSKIESSTGYDEALKNAARRIFKLTKKIDLNYVTPESYDENISVNNNDFGNMKKIVLVAYAIIIIAIIFGNLLRFKKHKDRR